VRFKLDENMDVPVASLFVAAGHDVETAYGEGLAGEPDDVVGPAAIREGRLLVTLDRGFGDVRRYPPGSHAGVVLLRLHRQSLGPQYAAVELLLDYDGLESLVGCTVVVSGSSIRVRRPT
jgi:predicted nuclease of predicted toxin-antitoxin system